MKKTKRQIIKKRAGELGHIDAHHLNISTIANDNNKYYLVAVVDSCSRIAWVEVTNSLKSIEVMFATMRCFYRIANQFGISFEEVITDNAREFATNRTGSESTKLKNLQNHPFERLLLETKIKHRYTKPPQTDDKVERFWRIIEEDLIIGTDFDSIEEFKQELENYLLYYNYERPHQGLGMNGKPPAKFLENLATN